MSTDPLTDKTVARAALDKMRKILAGNRVRESDNITSPPVEVASAGSVVSVEESFTGTIDDLVQSIELAASRSSDGTEFWSAHVLMRILGYASDSWLEFKQVMVKAQYACERSDQRISDHFSGSLESLPAQDGVEGLKVTRYAAYLISQNGDSRRKQVAYAQTYFAAQTRKQQLHEQSNRRKNDEQQRVTMRERIAEHNKFLAEAAREAGVETSVDFARFQNFGYKGLYNGLDVAGIRDAKQLPTKAKILDHMDITELAANFFRATQAEDKLRREKILGKDQANAAHFEVGRKVRKAIRDIGGTMPEKLQPAEDIDKVRRRMAQLSNESISKK